MGTGSQCSSCNKLSVHWSTQCSQCTLISVTRHARYQIQFANVLSYLIVSSYLNLSVSCLISYFWNLNSLFLCLVSSFSGHVSSFQGLVFFAFGHAVSSPSLSHSFSSGLFQSCLVLSDLVWSCLVLPCLISFFIQKLKKMHVLFLPRFKSMSSGICLFWLKNFFGVYITTKNCKLLIYLVLS